MPVVVDEPPNVAIGLVRDRPLPEIEVECRVRRGWGPRNRGPAVVIEASGKPHLADRTSVQSFNRFAHPRATLVAHLHEAIVPACRGHDQFRLVRILAAGLLDIDVLASLHRQHRRGRVPEVWSCNKNRVERCVVEARPKIDDARTGRVLLCRHGLHADGQPLRIDFRKVGDVDIGQRQDRIDVFHPAAQSDDGHPQPAVAVADGRLRLSGYKGRHRRTEPEGRGPMDG